MLMELVVTAVTCLSIRWLTPSNAGGLDDHENFDNSTPFFDPSSAKDSSPSFDSVSSEPTMVTGRSGPNLTDPYENNDLHFHPFPFDLTPDCAFENKSYRVITDDCSLSSEDNDWFRFSLLSDSKVTISLHLNSGTLADEYLIELYHVYLWDREPGQVQIWNNQKLAGFYRGTADYADTFYLKAGSYLVHLGYPDDSYPIERPAFDYRLEICSLYLVRDDLDIFYAKNFLDCGAAYWEGDYFPYNIFDDFYGGSYDQIGTPHLAPHLDPDAATDLIPQRVWGENDNRPHAPQTLLFIWSNELKNSFADVLEALVTELSDNYSQISSKNASIETQFNLVSTAANVVVEVLPINGVIKIVIEASFQIIGDLFSTLLDRQEADAAALLDYFSDLLSLARVHINPNASSDTQEFNGEILVIPMEIYGYGDGDDTGVAGFYRPKPSLTGDNYFYTDSVIEAFPENAISRGNIWLASDNASLVSKENFVLSLPYSYGGLTINELRQGQDDVASDVLEGSVMGVPQIREPYGHYVFKFVAPRTGTFSFEMTGYFESLGVAADLSKEWPSTTDCSTLLVPCYQHIFGEIHDYPEMTSKNIGTLVLQKGETIYIRFHGPNWDSYTGRNSIMPTLLISELPHLEHDYSSRFEDFDATMHRAYCSCGEYVLEPHDYSLQGNPFMQGNICSRCGHSRLQVVIPSLP